ncbi:MAG: SRPBCC domain-containing protein [Saprospiraceae bacterium]|nr:SRPBCC domain-containing protein [Saprospiraceae bacterium]
MKQQEVPVHGYRPDAVTWKIHLRSSPSKVFAFLTTDAGRAAFWAESAVEHEGEIQFTFSSGVTYRGRVIRVVPSTLFELDYFASLVRFELEDDGQGGTDLTVTNTHFEADVYLDLHAGWISVLMALKAAADHGIDLRNHDPERTWSQGYADN